MLSKIRRTTDVWDYVRKNEVGDAELLLSLFPGRFCYDPALKSWFHWNGNCWEVDRGKGGITRAIDEVVETYMVESRGSNQSQQRELFSRMSALNTYQRRSHVIKLSESMAEEAGIAVEKWDEDPHILPCINGTIELKNGNFREGRQEDRCKVCCPTKWRGILAKAPQWEKFLRSVLGEDPEVLNYMRRLMGYSLLGSVREHILPILWGAGRNGKGTMLEAIHSVLGEMAGPVHSEMLLDQGRSRSSGDPSPDILALRGRRIVWANETDEGRKMSTARVKWLCGGDTLVGRALYSNTEVSFRPTHTLFLLTNHRPKVDAEDYAIWQRIHLIPFNFSFVEYPASPSERKRDTRMLDRLKGEAEGILAWMVRGHMEWREYGMRIPTTLTQAVVEYREEEDVMGRFLEERCEVGEEMEIRADVLYQNYKGWCGGLGVRPAPHFKFGADIEKRFKRVRRAQGRIYLGVREKRGSGVALV